jgi:hypothetical protein
VLNDWARAANELAGTVATVETLVACIQDAALAITSVEPMDT